VLALAALWLVLLPARTLVGQGSPAPVFHGVVSDARSGQPVADALVVAIVASAASTDTIQTLSGSDGTFTLRPRATGDVTATVRVRRLGFAPSTMRVGVREHGSIQTAARFALTPLALQLDATVITAARREQRLKDAVVPIEIVARAEIERSGATDVASVLTEQLGVQLEGGLPAGAGVQMQGLGTNRVLILLDGQPLVGRINGNLDLSRLPTANLERIEVIKGPQSTLYGSDAMGGVINLVTRRASGDRTDASMQMIGGSRGRMDLSGSLLSGTERIRGGVDVGIRSLQLAPGISGDVGTFAQRQEVSPQLRVQLSDAWRIESSALLIGEQQRYRTGQLFRFADRDQQSARVGAHWQQGAHRAGMLLYRSRFDHLARASTLDQPQSDAGERDRQELTELELTWSGPFVGTIVDAGLELRRESIVADRIDSLRRAFNAAEPFAQITLGGGALTVTPGVRFTWNEQWGNYATPRVAALWRPVNALSVRATVGRGFRAPDFKELYLSFANAQAGYAVQGNTMLRPETSTSAQLNVEYAADRAYVRASGFENRLREFIEFVEADAAGLYTYGNVASARTRGIELESGFTSGRVRLESGVAFLDARDVLTTRVLLGRPRWSGRLSASAGQVLGARVSATLLYTGDTPLQREASGVVSSTQPAFTRVDLRAARSVGAGVDLSIGVDNLANRQLGAGWPGFTGRQWYGGLTWTPNPAAVAR
jgi:outer membrane receptor for ferrienterochelin and colicins